MDRSEALERPGWEGRPVAIPDDVGDPAIVKASVRVRLPRHVYWSGEDLMIEGRDDNVRRFIDIDELVAMWPNLFLPKRVRAASSEAWLRQRHDARL